MQCESEPIVLIIKVIFVEMQNKVGKCEMFCVSYISENIIIS